MGSHGQRLLLAVGLSSQTTHDHRNAMIVDSRAGI